MSKMVPEGWDNKSIGSLLVKKTIKTTQNNQHTVLSVTKNGIFPQRDYFKKQIASENNIGYKIIEKGDLVFSTMNLWMGSLDVLKTSDIGIVSPAYSTFEFNNKNCITEFMSFLMRDAGMIQKYVQHSQMGASIVRRNLDIDGLLKDSIPIPPLPEQKKIASILTSVDEVIEKTQSQIDKLQDLKKGTMNELLTKGIGHTEFKDSELGRIPKSWEVKGLGDLIDSLTGGVSVNSENRTRKIDELGVLKTSCISKGEFFPAEHKAILKTENGRANTPVEKDRIIFSRMNTPNLVGESGYVEHSEPDLFLPDRLWLLDVKDRQKTSMRWLSWLLASRDVRTQLTHIATGTSGSMKNISKPNLLLLPVRTPKIHEQNKISSVITSVHSQIRKYQQKLHQTQSLKKSLMQDLLTGKVRVKGD